MSPAAIVETISLGTPTGSPRIAYAGYQIAFAFLVLYWDKGKEGLEAFYRLVTKSDIFIENNVVARGGPGMIRLGRRSDEVRR